MESKHSVKRAVLLCVFALGLAALLAACGIQAEPDPDPEPGTLSVTVTGLPAGVDGDVTVTGPEAYVRTVVASETLTGLTPGNHAITANAVQDDGQTYVAAVSSDLVDVPEGGSATTTVTYAVGPLADDGDSQVDPGLWALFRATSGGPVWVDRLLFNDIDPLDVRGVQLRNEVGDPADDEDWIQFSLVHGDGPSTTIDVSLECPVKIQNGTPSADSVIRADVLELDGTLVAQVLCDVPESVTISNDGGTTEHRIRVYSTFGDPFYVRYVLSLDAYCFPDCTYQPFEP